VMTRTSKKRKDNQYLETKLLYTGQVRYWSD
jgi:hypothetical protein